MCVRAAPVALLAAAALSSGCFSLRQDKALWHRGVVDPATRRLIAFWILKPTGDEPVTVDRDFGMFVIWDEHLRRFYLFDNPRKTYFVTTDFDLFLDEMKELPKGNILDWPDTCTVPRSWKMPAAASRRLSAAMAENHQFDTRSSDHPHIACYCESDGIKLLGAEPDGALYGARPRRTQRRRWVRSSGTSRRQQLRSDQ